MKKKCFCLMTPVEAWCDNEEDDDQFLKFLYKVILEKNFQPLFVFKKKWSQQNDIHTDL